MSKIGCEIRNLAKGYPSWFKGHNWDHGRGDICKKCGKVHVKPAGKRHTYDHGRNEPCKKCGEVHVHYNLGKHLSKKQRKKISASLKQDYKFKFPHGGMKGHNWDHGKGDVCKACGKVHVHPNSGRRFSKERRKQLSITLRGRLPSYGFRGHNYSHGRGDICLKCGEVHIAGMLGKQMSIASRNSISTTKRWKRMNEEKILAIFTPKNDTKLLDIISSNEGIGLSDETLIALKAAIFKIVKDRTEARSYTVPPEFITSLSIDEYVDLMQKKES